MYNQNLFLFFIGILIIFSQINAQEVKSNDAVPNEEISNNQTVSEEISTEQINDEISPIDGQRRRSRILNGHLSNDQNYRYQVAVMRIVKGSPVLVCGGAIIHRRYVLTAAHCVHQLRNCDLVVRSGGVVGVQFWRPQDEPRSFYRIIRTYIPKQYSSAGCKKHLHDIAILKLQQSFDLSDYERYQKVNLPEADSDYDGAIARIAGYGPDFVRQRTESGKVIEVGVEYVNKLRSLPLTVIPNEFCQNKIDVILTENSLCAVTCERNAQTCFNDDGGPLVHDGTVIGILNYRNCNIKVPEIFTKVSVYLPFINSVLKHQHSDDILIR